MEKRYHLSMWGELPIEVLETLYEMQDALSQAATFVADHAGSSLEVDGLLKEIDRLVNLEIE